MAAEPEGRFRDLVEPDRLRDLSAADRPTYRLIVRAEPGIEPVRALRWLLKAMLRQYGLRCLSIEPTNNERA